VLIIIFNFNFFNIIQDELSFSTKYVNLDIIHNFLHLKKGCFKKRKNGSSFVQVMTASNEGYNIVDVLVATSWEIKKS